MSKVLSAEQTATLGSFVKDEGINIPAGKNFMSRAKEAVKTFTNKAMTWGGVAAMVVGVGMAASSNSDYAQYATPEQKDLLFKGACLAGAGLVSTIAGGVRSNEQEKAKRTIGFEEARRAMNTGR